MLAVARWVRPHKFPSGKEGAIILFSMYYDYTHRELAADSKRLFGKRFEQSLLSHYMDRIPLGWLMQVGELLDEKVDSFYDDASVGICDSTEYATGMYKAAKSVLDEVRKMETVKGHIQIAKYRPNSVLKPFR